MQSKESGNQREWEATSHGSQIYIKWTAMTRLGFNTTLGTKLQNKKKKENYRVSLLLCYKPIKKKTKQKLINSQHARVKYT